MNETIVQKLDMLAEFHAQKDLLEIDKRKLLDDVKIPAEVEAVVSEGMKAMAEIENSMRATAKIFDANIEKELAKIVVPDDLRKALNELRTKEAILMTQFSDIEKQRATINTKKRENDNFLTQSINVRKQELQAEIEAKTKAVYAQVAQRKLEIEAEFSGRAEDVEENIKKLEAEIKEDMKKQAAEKLAVNPKSKDLSVKGQYFHALYVKARKTWIPTKLDDYVETHPDIKNCYTEGEPSITLRRV